MRLPKKGETAIDVIRAEGITDSKEIHDYLDQVAVAWHEKKFGNTEITVVMGLSFSEYDLWIHDRLDIDKFQLTASR